MARWFAWPAILYAAPVPLLVAAGRLRAVHGLAQTPASATPFLAALALFVLSYIGLGISFYPYIVPPRSPSGGRGPGCEPVSCWSAPWS